MKSIFVAFSDIVIHGQIRLRFHKDMKRNYDRLFRIDIHSIRLKKLSNLQERENVWKSCLIFNKITDFSAFNHRKWKLFDFLVSFSWPIMRISLVCIDERNRVFWKGEILNYIIGLMTELTAEIHLIQPKFWKSLRIIWFPRIWPLNDI